MSEAEKSEVFQHFGAYSGYDQRYYDHFNVKRGLRNADGTGVVAGITSISNVHGYLTDEGVKIPDEGRLTIRGYDIKDLVDGAVAEGRPGYEEVAYLLLTGDLPTASQLENFRASIDSYRDLPRGFVNNLIMNFPSKNVMNMMARSVLMLYAMDSSTETDVVDPEHEVQIAVQMLSRLPRIAVLSYLASRQHEDPTAPMYINPPLPGLSTAETVLHMLRHDMEWTPQEARMLDIMLMLHAEHGGGNNSTFTTHVVSSSGTDTYSAIAAALGSLKGPKHGGANIKVVRMFRDMKEQVKDWTNENEICDYLTRLLDKKAFDNAGLIYGMGHAVYSVSDPRARIMERFAEGLSKEKGREDEYGLYMRVARLAPQVIAEKRRIYKGVSANVDFYSGFIYSMLDLPMELYTPIFACARIAGWSAHRIEELINAGKIIRPAYKAIHPERAFPGMESET